LGGFLNKKQERFAGINHQNQTKMNRFETLWAEIEREFNVKRLAVRCGIRITKL
jgi:hypothetical protein